MSISKTTARIPQRLSFEVKVNYYQSLVRLAELSELSISDKFFTSMLSGAVAREIPKLDGLPAVVKMLVKRLPVLSEAGPSATVALELERTQIALAKTICAFAQGELMRDGIGQPIYTTGDFVAIAISKLKGAGAGGSYEQLRQLVAADIEAEDERAKFLAATSPEAIISPPPKGAK